jgi:hypothetical protein
MRRFDPAPRLQSFQLFILGDRSGLTCRCSGTCSGRESVFHSIEFYAAVLQEKDRSLTGSPLHEVVNRSRARFELCGLRLNEESLKFLCYRFNARIQNDGLCYIVPG